MILLIAIKSNKIKFSKLSSTNCKLLLLKKLYITFAKLIFYASISISFWGNNKSWYIINLE